MAGAEGFEPSARGFGERQCNFQWVLDTFILYRSIQKNVFRSGFQALYALKTCLQNANFLLVCWKNW